MISNLHFFDLIIGLVYLILGYPILYFFFRNQLAEAFKAYTFKVFFAYGFCLIYLFYYQGGDTFLYWDNSAPYVKLLFSHPDRFLTVLVQKPTMQNFYLFTNETGYPDHNWYYKNDGAVLSMFKFVFFVRVFSFGNYISATMVLSIASFIISFKFYQLFQKVYPSYWTKYALLYMPSLAFWGSGILKDTYTFSATLLIVYCVYKMIHQNIKWKYVFLLLLGVYVIISVKPYIFLSLLPALLLWILWKNIQRIQHPIIRLTITPFVIASGVFVGFILWQNFSPLLGQYSSTELIVKKAYVSYNDLRKDYYGGNSFDLGDYDPSVQGMLSKFFPATIAGLFRPYLWESRNVTMLISGVENFFILLFTVYVISRARTRFFSYVFSDSFQIFCFIFSIVFAFSIAISTSNFGALVRFKIPLIPFYLLMLIGVLETVKKKSVVLSKAST